MRVFRPQRTRDETVDRNLDAIAAALTDVGNLPVAQGLEGGPAAVFEASQVIDQETWIFYKGAVAATLTLPGAMSLGNNVSRVIHIANDSAAAVTVAVDNGETLSGSAAVAATVKATYVSDGASRWYRWV